MPLIHTNTYIHLEYIVYKLMYELMELTVLIIIYNNDRRIVRNLYKAAQKTVMLQLHLQLEIQIQIQCRLFIRVVR